MMEIITNTTQAITTGSNVLFTTTVVPGNCSIMHRSGSGLVTLRGLTNGQCRARFKVTFSGNISADSSETITSTTLLSAAIALNGEPLAGTTMTTTVAGTTSVYNISTTVIIDVPSCCCQTISVKNTSDLTIDISNANLIVERVA